MSQDWQNFDLRGGGLQSANLRLARLLKRRPTAYALTVIFPLGLHRDYLGDRRGGWVYRGAAAAALACALAGKLVLAAIVLAALACGALYDAVRTESRIARINKRLRMAVYLGQGEGPPPGYRGRPEAAAASGPGRTPSFDEQERLLRDLARQRDNKGN